MFLRFRVLVDLSGLGLRGFRVRGLGVLYLV